MKQLNLKKPLKHVCQLIISTSNVTLEVSSLHPWAAYPSENESKVTKLIKYFAIPNFMVQVRKLQMMKLGKM